MEKSIVLQKKGEFLSTKRECFLQINGDEGVVIVEFVSSGVECNAPSVGRPGRVERYLKHGLAVLVAIRSAEMVPRAWEHLLVQYEYR